MIIGVENKNESWVSVSFIILYVFQDGCAWHVFQTINVHKGKKGYSGVVV